MSEWRAYSLELGMPLMSPGQVSEVELLKWLGDFQWRSIAERVGCRAIDLANAEGDRLYASFLTIDLQFPPESGPESFVEGSTLHVANHIATYAHRFVEGRFVLSADAGADAHPRAQARMTNAFVARHGANTRLKVQEPVGLAGRPGATLPHLPAAIQEHMEVQATGRVGPDSEGARAMGVEREARWPIGVESDLNGAGLLYFARYVAIMDFAVRSMVSEHLSCPVSGALIAGLCTERRRIFYFANADAHDTVRARVRGAWLPLGPNEGVSGAEGRRCWARLRFDLDLYRASDGVLMASGAVWKRWVVADADKALVSEMARLLLRSAP